MSTIGACLTGGSFGPHEHDVRDMGGLLPHGWHKDRDQGAGRPHSARCQPASPRHRLRNQLAMW